MIQIFRLIREILQRICTPEKPIIFFMDDLTYAGSEAIELFTFLAADTYMRNFMMIGTQQQQ